MQGHSSRVNTPSPFSTQSTSPGAITPSLDAKWATGSEWSMGASASSSRAASPTQQVAHQMPASIPIDQVVRLLAMASQGRLLPSPFAPLQFAPAPETTASRPATPETPKRGRRIPRPPNAFMLYRSNLIKTGRIPKDIEQRQQNISRVAGECWNLLDDVEKEYWHGEAAKAVTEHQLKHPDYKFSPSRKSYRRKAAPEEASGVDKDKYVRHLRERYVGIIGDAKPPPRPRKPKSRRGVECDSPVSRSLPGSLNPSPSSSPLSFRVPSAPPSLAASPALQPSAHGFGNIPEYTLDALGIVPLGPIPLDLLAQHVATNLLQPQPADRDDEATPKASNFGRIALPTQPKFNFDSSAAAGPSTPEGDLGLVYPSVAGPSQQSDATRPSTPGVSQWDVFLKYPDPLTATSGANLEEPVEPSSVYAYGEFTASMDSFTSSLFTQSE